MVKVELCGGPLDGAAVMVPPKLPKVWKCEKTGAQYNKFGLNHKGRNLYVAAGVEPPAEPAAQ